MDRNTKETSEVVWLKRISQSNYFWMAVSLLIAVILWMYVTSTEGIEIEKTITGVKIEYIGEDSVRESSGLVVTEQNIQKVNITVSGTRRLLNKLNNSNVTATVNLYNISSDGRYSVSYGISYPSGVNSEDISVVRKSAEIVTFYVDRLASKTVEVKAGFSGTTAEGYFAGDIILDPMVIKVTAPKTILANVNSAIINITRENLGQSLQYSTTYLLVDENGSVIDNDMISCDTDEVMVTMEVLATKTVPLDVTIIDGAGATREANTEISIEPSVVTLAGDAGIIGEITKINLGTIDLASFIDTYSSTFTIVPPDGTENLTGISEAEVTVNIKGLSNRTFVVKEDAITLDNLPDEYSAEIITKSLEISVRAPESIISQIQSDDIKVIADMSEVLPLTPGGIQVPVKVSISDWDEAAAVLKYKIFVEIS